MNKNYTLKELANIGAKAAEDERSTMAVSRGHEDFGIDAQAREAFTKAVLDAVGYEFPKDEEREAFNAWWQTSNSQTFCDAEEAFKAWKAGREELRRSINKEYATPEKMEADIQALQRPSYSFVEQSKAIDELAKESVKYEAAKVWEKDAKTEPAWIPWDGGECPLPDGVKRWEMRTRAGAIFDCLCGKAGRWNHKGTDGDIVAYRVIE